MKFSKILLLIVLPMIVISLSYCSLFEEDSDGDGGATLTITHDGIDWSTLSTGSEVSYDQIDGETIAWCEPGQRITEITGIWYRSFNNQVYLYGSGDLSQVQAVEQNRWQSDVCSTPLAVGDIWVAECRDGYVKFKVLSVGDPDGEWEAEVEYQYSADGSF